MLESSGGEITIIGDRPQGTEILEKYALTDAIEASYPQEGQLIDWAYGAGWDIKTSGGVVQ